MSVYEGIMQGLSEALEHVEGKRHLRANLVKARNVEPLKEYRPEEIRQIRSNLGMTQVVFASFMGVSSKTVEAWEAGRNMPDGPARRIMSLVQKDPELPQKYSIIDPPIKT